MSEQQLLDAEEIAIPDISQLEIEDDKPVDNFQSEKQQRLLVEPLYSNPVLTTPFIAAANVGLFYSRKQDPLVPDAFISLNVQMPADWSQKQNRSYFVWEFGKAPEVAIEIVSNRKGKELGAKKEDYARVGIPYYAVFDPLQQIQEAEQMNGALLRVYALTAGKYVELESPFWLETVGIGLTLWTGTFEEQPGLWLRWCDVKGDVIPTGKELSERERQRAEREQQRATRLAERLREMGVDPDTI
ncbi:MULTISPECIES: Uma2 family endonuclease [Nostocales]|uniref:Uma2 family endonuclease n=3 Tax=Nostocales TaxID=1161 RepID=A0A0C1R476_9CYAN|nr:Uma2 family endonuclease [Tolypothrix bouteillei]KAF3889462.1 Uma2 family endonuclease [Tolypothrix bouteillei VB521301]